MKNLEKLNLVDVNNQEVKETNGGKTEGHWVQTDLWENSDGTWAYFGDNELAYAGVALHNAAVTVSNWF